MVSANYMCQVKSCVDDRWKGLSNIVTQVSGGGQGGGRGTGGGRGEGGKWDSKMAGTGRKEEKFHNIA